MTVSKLSSSLGLTHDRVALNDSRSILILLDDEFLNKVISLIRFSHRLEGEV